MARLVWITGAGRGIGRTVALRLARAGDTVIASARNTDALASLEREAESLSGRIIAQPLDVTDRAATAATLDAIEAEHGLPDQVIFNAGSHEPMAAARFDAGVFDRLFAVNLTGVVNGLDAIVPRFVGRRSGRIAVVSSVAGYFGMPTAAAYSASKAATIALCESLRTELSAFGVTVQVINPGFVRTPLTEKNDFPMPFLMEVDAAAERIARGIDSDRFEITFPRRFAWLLKVLKMMPYPVFFAAMRAAVPDWAKPGAPAREQGT